MKRKSMSKFATAATLCLGILTVGFCPNASAEAPEVASSAMPTLRANTVLDGELLHGLEISVNSVKTVEFGATLIAVDLGFVHLENSASKLKNCRISVMAFPDAGSSRINMKTETLSCEVTSNSNEQNTRFFEQSVLGYVVGADNVAGVPAKIKRRKGFKDENDTTYLDVRAKTKISIVLLSSVVLKAPKM